MGVSVCVWGWGCRRAANGTKIVQALALNKKVSSRKGDGTERSQKMGRKRGRER